MTDQPSMWQRSTTRRFLKWLFNWRILRRALIGFASLVTLWALLCTEENLRGMWTWEKYRQELEARGEQLDWQSFIPKPVPDDQNFAATPLIKSWFPKLKPEAWHDDFRQAEMRLKGNRLLYHVTDLSAWARAFTETNSPRRVLQGPIDPASRAQAAPLVLKALKKNESYFGELRAASGRPSSRYPVNYDVDEPFAILLPHLSGVREVCRQLGLKACAELAIGRGTEALEDVKLIFRLADSLNDEPFLISYLVRIACVQNAVQPIWEGLAEHRWSEVQLQEIQSRLQQYNFVADMKPCFASERAAGILLIDLVRQRGLGYLAHSTGTDLPLPLNRRSENLIRLLLPTRGWMYLEEYNLCRGYQTLLAGTFDGSLRRVFPDRLATNVREFDKLIHGNGGAVDALAAVFVHHRVIAAMLLPSLDRIPIKAAIAQTVVNESALACALERYWLANGNFPDKLDVLAPSYISPLPHDVITGEPYKYRRTDDGQFILYSVGWNETDDGGVPGKTDFDEKNGDWVWRYPTN